MDFVLTPQALVSGVSAGSRCRAAGRRLPGVARAGASSSAQRCGRIDARDVDGAARAAGRCVVRRAAAPSRGAAPPSARACACSVAKAATGCTRCSNTAGLRFSRGPRQPSGLSYRVVVLHGQLGDGERQALRLRADVLSLRTRARCAPRRRRVRVARGPGLDGASRHLTDTANGTIPCTRAPHAGGARAGGRRRLTTASLGQGLVRERARRRTAA